MGKSENVINYYVLCNKLKNITRTGWKNWNVEKERLESVAEHIYGVQMLALAIYSEYKCDIDISKVILMLSIHELGEIKIGDLTQFQISKEEKAKLEYEAVKDVASSLLIKDELIDLFLEFESRNTKESLFAHYCDKLECDLQAKLYGEEGLVDLSHQENNKIMDNDRVRSLLERGMSWEEMWLNFGQQTYNYDDNFKDVSNYALTHRIGKK